MLRRTPFRVLLLAAAAALVAAGCGDDDPTGPTDPPDTPVEITETFPPDEPGTLTPNGGITHAFAVQRAGSITVTLTHLEPADAVVGLSLGTWNGSACAQTITNDAADQGETLLGTATVTGNYCVRIFDAAGNLTQAVQYQVTVRHF